MKYVPNHRGIKLEIACNHSVPVQPFFFTFSTTFNRLQELFNDLL